MLPITVLSIKMMPAQPKICELELDCWDKADEGKKQKVTLSFQNVKVNGQHIKDVKELITQAFEKSVSVQLVVPDNYRTCHEASFSVS